mgnify:CR=1 FL=1
MSEETEAKCSTQSLPEQGAVSVESFHLPPSGFLHEHTLPRLLQLRQAEAQHTEAMPAAVDIRYAPREQLPAIRQQEREAFYASPMYTSLKAHCPTTVTEAVVAGVGTETFLPPQGVKADKRQQVLINLHGGGFLGGSRTSSHYESMPIAALGQYKVVSVDYRMAPEHKFPAASDDVLAVYRQLLKDYAPEAIGIYGSSAGALLTAQALARFQAEGLPVPGAVAMLAAGAFYWMEGDSGPIGCAVTGLSCEDYQLEQDVYFKGVNPNNPLAFPGRCDATLSRFPPSLLIASIRDFALSSVVTTHNRLVKQGVEADLHLWDGLDHVFYGNPELSESREVYELVVRFFDRHLKSC